MVKVKSQLSTKRAPIARARYAVTAVVGCVFRNRDSVKDGAHCNRSPLQPPPVIGCGGGGGGATRAKRPTLMRATRTRRNKLCASSSRLGNCVVPAGRHPSRRHVWHTSSPAIPSSRSVSYFGANRTSYHDLRGALFGVLSDTCEWRHHHFYVVRVCLRARLPYYRLNATNTNLEMKIDANIQILDVIPKANKWLRMRRSLSRMINWTPIK